MSKFYISFPLDKNDKNAACEVCEPVSYSRKIWQISAGTGRSLNVFNDSSYRAVFVISHVHPSKLNTKYELKMFVIIQGDRDMKCL